MQWPKEFFVGCSTCLPVMPTADKSADRSGAETKDCFQLLPSAELEGLSFKVECRPPIAFVS